MHACERKRLSTVRRTRLASETERKLFMYTILYSLTIFWQQKMTELRDVWEATSFELEKLQTNPLCVEQEQVDLKTRKAPKWTLSFDPNVTKLRSIGTHTCYIKHRAALFSV